jgi:hypothetical protein
LLSVLFLWVPLAVSAEAYRLVDISPLLPPSSRSIAVDLRDNGTISGMLEGSGGRLKPFVVHGDGRVEVFDSGFYDEHYVRAGNGAGTLVGSYPGSSVGWARIGSELACIPTPLPCGSASLYLSSIPWAINEDGVLVGSQSLQQPDGSFRSQGYRASADSGGAIQVHGLGRWLDQFDTAATVIGEGPQPRVLGFAVTDAATSEYQPLQWQNSGWVALGAAGRNRVPIAVNAAGVAVGAVRGPSGQAGFSGLRWDLGDSTNPGEPLPDFPGASSTRPSDINGRSEIVGAATIGAGPIDTRGWLLRAGVLTALNDLLLADPAWIILTAAAINEAGQIAATARFGSQPGTRVVLLIPEPADAIFRHSF